MPRGHLNPHNGEVTGHALSLTLVKMVAESHGCQDGGKPNGYFVLQGEPRSSARIIQ